MRTEPTTTLVLRDALDRTLANPAASWAWHLLGESYREAADEDVRLLVRQTLIAQIPPHGIEGFLHATFLAGVTGEAGHIAEAGERVQRVEPVDADRLMAFATYEWGRAIAQDGDRSRFLAQLRHARLPEIMRMAGLHVREAGRSPLVARTIDRIRKVALVTSFIGETTHTPTGLALQHARLLQEIGMEVRLFSCQELSMPYMSHYLGNAGTVLTPPPQLDALATHIPPGVAVTLGESRFSLTRRWRDMLGIVAAFDPDLILFIGLNSPFVAPFYETRPVLGLCIHSVAPMAPVDVWLTSSRALADRRSAAWGPAMPPAWGHYHPYRVSLKPAGAPVARAQLQVTEQDMVLITVGARLQDEITGEWAARMRDLLTRRPQLVWLLVGGQAMLPAALAGVPPAQLRLIAYRDDLRSVLGCCDIYVNPPRMGGGFSVAEAMAEGLAVVAFADSDGGDKLGEHADDNLADYFDKLQTLIDQPSLREQTGAAMRDLFSGTLDLERSGPSLSAACAQTLTCFQQRAGSAA